MRRVSTAQRAPARATLALSRYFLIIYVACATLWVACGDAVPGISLFTNIAHALAVPAPFFLAMYLRAGRGGDAAAAAAATGAFIYLWCDPFPRPAPPAPPATLTKFTLLHWNAAYRLLPPERIAESVRAAGADAANLVEVSPEAAPVLAEKLKDLYPYQ